MKPNYKNLCMVLALLASGAILAGLFIHSCGGGYIFDMRNVATSTPTPDPEAPYIPYTTSWSEGFDFSEGEFTNVAPTESGGSLQLSTGDEQDFRPTQICVAVPGNNSVYLHNLETPSTRTIVSLTPYNYGVTNMYPSRTAIDKDGNCWVAGGTSSGGSGAIYKISKEGIVIGKKRMPGTNPRSRAVAIDKNGFVWVGEYYATKKMYKVSPNEDTSIDISVNDTAHDNLTIVGNSGGYAIITSASLGSYCPHPYGAAIDSQGYLWVVGKVSSAGCAETDGSINQGFISKIDTATGEAICDMRTDVYGIVIDRDDYPWIGGYASSTGNFLNKVKKDCSGYELSLNLRTLAVSESWEVPNPGSILTRGVGMDTDGNIWVADSANDFIYKFDYQALSSVGAYLGKVTTDPNNAGNCGPIGVSGDPYGHIWAVNQSCGILAKIEKDIIAIGNNSDKVTVATTGVGTYSYSDMVGMGLFSTVLKGSGTWRVKFNSGCDEPNWRYVTWHSKENESTRVGVRVRVAADEAGLESASWNEYDYDSPAPLNTLPNLRWAQVEVYFYTLDTQYSPQLSDLSLQFECPEL